MRPNSRSTTVYGEASAHATLLRWTLPGGERAKAPLMEAEAPKPPKHQELLDHVEGLTTAALSVETAAATRPAGPEREALLGLADRLRRSLVELKDDIASFTRSSPPAPPCAKAADRIRSDAGSPTRTF